MAEYLVTGGAGFIGSHIVEALIKQDHQVAVIDDLSTGKYNNISHLQEHIDFFEGSICDEALLRKALMGVKIVFHQAAISSVLRSVENPWPTHQANVEGTLKLLIAARETGVKRVIFAGSSSVYGDIEDPFKVESMKSNPCSPYAASKIAGEDYCQVFWKVYSLETVTLRYFNVFGARQNPFSSYAAVIPKFIIALLQDQAPVVFGDGEQTRDFTYIENVISANLAAARVSSEKIAGKVFNIACGQKISLNQLLDFLGKLLKKDIKANYTSPRSGDVRHSRADISLAQSYLGYTPSIDVWEGLKKTTAWFSQQAL